jgi:transposase
MRRPTSIRDTIQWFPRDTICAGIDIGDRYSQIAVLDEDGEVSEKSRIRTTPAAFQRHFQGKPPMRLAMEVGTHSPWLSQLLARLCRFDPQLLYPIGHKTEAARAVWSILRSRDALVRSRTMLINHARGIVKPTGHRLPKCSSRRFGKLQDKLPEYLCPALEPILQTVNQLNDQIQVYNRQIECLGRDQYPETALMQQVPGVGPITALTYSLTIGDPWRFARNRDVGAYLGLVPRRSQTGQSDPELPITKAGNRYLRSLLVQCSHYILGPFGPDSDLRRSGQRIALRGGKNAKKRARVAVARRLAVMLLSMWKTGEVYDPLHGSANESSAA